MLELVTVGKVAASREVKSVVILDDEQIVLDEYEVALRPRTVRGSRSVPEALDLNRRHLPHLVLVDLWLERRCHSHSGGRPAWGIDVIRELRQDNPMSMIVLLTGGFSNAYASAACSAGANGALPKYLGASKNIAIIEHDMLVQEPASQRPMSLARAEYEYLTKTYVDNDRNVSKTATDLAIPRSTLYRKLHKHAPRR